MTDKLVIQNGILLSMKEGYVPHQADIYIEGDRILAVENDGNRFPIDDTTIVIDATECVVMPGLINAHTHTPMTIVRSTRDNAGWPTQDTPPTLPPGQDWRANMTPEDHYWSTRLAIAEMIHTGTTTFIDMYHDMDKVAQAVMETGIRAGLGWEILTIRYDLDEWFAYDEDTAKRKFEEGASFASEWHGKGEGRINTLIAPHETATCHEPWLTRSAHLADELGLDITIHVAEGKPEVEYCRKKFDMTPVEVLRKAGIFNHHVIGAHSVHLTDSDIAILAASDYVAVSCMSCYLHIACDATPVPKLVDAGVVVALGTDSAISNNNLNLWEEIYLTANVHGFLARDASLIPGDLALRMATIGGAQALGMEKELGTLEPGKKADVIVVDVLKPHLRPVEGALIGNLIHSASGHEVRDMIVDGKLLMRDQKILSFSEDEVISNVDASVRRLRREVGLPYKYERPVITDAHGERRTAW